MRNLPEMTGSTWSQESSAIEGFQKFPCGRERYGCSDMSVLKVWCDQLLCLLQQEMPVGGVRVKNIRAESRIQAAIRADRLARRLDKPNSARLIDRSQGGYVNFPDAVSPMRRRQSPFRDMLGDVGVLRIAREDELLVIDRRRRTEREDRHRNERLQAIEQIRDKMMFDFASLEQEIVRHDFLSRVGDIGLLAGKIEVKPAHPYGCGRTRQLSARPGKFLAWTLLLPAARE